MLHICVCVGGGVSVVAGARELECACARVVLLTQRATRRRIANCGLSGSTTFWKLTHKRLDFRKNFADNKMCILIFSTTFI